MPKKLTFFDFLHNKITLTVQRLETFADRIWYPPLIGFLAAIDHLVLIIPSDGILISSAMLTPKRWVTLASCVAVGSTVGAIVLAAVVEAHGLPWILQTYPGIDQTSWWTLSRDLFERYGLLMLFAIAATPVVQQPIVILASLANTPLFEMTVVIFTGRIAKFLFIAYLGSHAPRYLKKLWGLKGEMKDAGVKLE